MSSGRGFLIPCNRIFSAAAGLTLADLIESLLRSPIKNREAIKLANHALGSGDFLTEPQIGGPSHISYTYDPPGSLHVVDIAIDTPHGTIPSIDIRLWLRDIAV